ncbi:MAG: DUF2231 domain-containing protein [Syntrophobacteraceae bacterium]
MLELSLEELAERNGREGKPVYIAYEGKIYDVSQSKLWKTGAHMNRHASGKDLGIDISAAPHGPEVLERYPQVGVIRKETAANREKVTFLEPLFKRYAFLRRHPHPMTVHFPIVFNFSATFFTLLYLITGNPSYEATAFHCLTASVIFTPLVMLTGFVSWTVNYLGRPVRAISIKMSISLVMFAVSLCAFFWRTLSPGIITSFRGASLIYLLLIFSLSPMVGIVGWYGAKLTFPLEK